MTTDLRLTVRYIESLTSSVRLFRLASAEGSALPIFAAGAHIKVQVVLPGGRDDQRSYSLVNSHGQNGEYVIAVQREPAGRGGSAFMHGLAVGALITSTPPINDFTLATGASLHVLIAGGIGITPILSMANALRVAGQPFELHYAARTADSMAFRLMVESIAQGDAHLCFDDGDPARGLKIAEIIGTPQQGRHIYVCGPGGMINAVREAAQSSGWPKSHVHFESFGPAAEADDGLIEVTLRRSGRTISVPPQQSILDALLGAGIDHPHDCKRGECSSCQVDVLEGIPDNRDYCLFGPEYESGKVMCVCVSRSKTPKLILDL